MSKQITNIRAEEILDSRGNPTIKVTVSINEINGSFSVPSGASTGKFEALELRDNDPIQFHGLGVNKAIEKVEKEIAPALIGLDITNQKEIDSTMIELDGTPNKSNLGANSMIGVSIACAKAAAAADKMEVFEYLRTLADIKQSQPIPYLFMNLVNGGKHAKSKLCFQEYYVIPMTENIDESIKMGSDIQNKLKELSGAEKQGDEGGLIIDTEDVIKPLEFLRQAVTELGYAEKVRLGLDVAASSFFESEKNIYHLADKEITPEELMNLYKSAIKDFALFSIEDPFQENDFQNFGKLLSEGIMVIGDDLTTTNKTRLQEAINQKSINGIIIKPNQIGTLTETLETMRMARVNNIDCVISHRSGETEDDFIADLACAFGCFGLKSGSPLKQERIIKYNRLKYITNLK